MELQLIKGNYNAADALEILTGVTEVKIRFHEMKISQHDSEEDIKMREARIKELQQELAAARRTILAAGERVTMVSAVHIQP